MKKKGTKKNKNHSWKASFLCTVEEESVFFFVRWDFQYSKESSDALFSLNLPKSCQERRFLYLGKARRLFKLSGYLHSFHYEKSNRI